MAAAGWYFNGLLDAVTADEPCKIDLSLPWCAMATESAGVAGKTPNARQVIPSSTAYSMQFMASSCVISIGGYVAASKVPRAGAEWSPWVSARTPGHLGIRDQSDPNLCTLLGDSPSILGFQDHADPTLNWVNGGRDLVGRRIGRATDGSPLSLPVGQKVPESASGTWKLTADLLLGIFPAATREYMKQVSDELNRDLPRYGLDSRLRCAHFFAQTREEAGASLSAKVENLNYSEEGLRANFKYYRAHPARAKDDSYSRDLETRKITRHADERAIANNVYASRNGNGDAASGDGWKFRGRGLIQVTGRANYRTTTIRYRQLYGGDVDFETDPDLMASFPYSVRSAVCFWVGHKLHILADGGATNAVVDSITKVINLHANSYAERRANFRLAQNALNF